MAVAAAIALCIGGVNASVAAEGASLPNTPSTDDADSEMAADRAGTAEATNPPRLETTSEEAEAESIFDKIWGYAKLYDNEENRVIQWLDFKGRFQLDYANVSADQGNHEEWNIRRFRLGAKAQFFHDFVAHVEVDLAPQDGYAYKALTDAYISWEPKRAFKFIVGKQHALFTIDGQTSSTKLLTVERNNLSNNIWFTEDYIPGVSIGGKPGHWMYQAGAFASTVDDGEFGNVSGGVFAVGTIGYNFNEALNVDEALLRLNYVYNAPENTSSGSLFANRPLEQIVSLNFNLETEKWGVRTDLSAATGYGTASDIWGAMVMPWYNINKHFQVVTRYTFVRGTEAGSVRLNRYENQVVSKKGDEYQEWYLGLNWFLYGHKLKLQTGVDYAHMADRASAGGAYNGWGWTTGLRISW